MGAPESPRHKSFNPLSLGFSLHLLISGVCVCFFSLLFSQLLMKREQDWKGKLSIWFRD